MCGSLVFLWHSAIRSDALFQVFKYLLILICCTYASCELVSQIFLDKQWEDFKQIHEKTYTKQEESKRFQNNKIFLIF